MTDPRQQRDAKLRALKDRATVSAMSADDQAHQRRAPRVSHEVMVAVRGERGSFTGWGTNLSSTGVFVNSQSPATAGDEVSVLLQLPGVPECKLRGRVAWASQPGPRVEQTGMGIEFLETDEATRQIIAQMVDRLREDLKPNTAA